MPPNANTTTLALPPKLTHSQAAATLAGLQQALTASTASIATDTALVLDASALMQFDTSALAVLLECRRTVLAQGRTLQVQGLPVALQQISVLYGVDGLLGVSAKSVE